MPSCRFCLQPSESNQQLQDRDFLERAQDIFSLPIPVSEDSRVACESCVARVDRFYSFKHRCRQLEELRQNPNQKKLSKGFAVKTEIEAPVEIPKKRSIRNFVLRKKPNDPVGEEIIELDHDYGERQMESVKPVRAPRPAGKRLKKVPKPMPMKRPQAKKDELSDDDGVEPVEFEFKLKRSFPKLTNRENTPISKEQLATRSRKELYFERRHVVCDQCGVSIQDASLEAHRNKHLGVRPYPCQVVDCDAKFYDDQARKNHHSRMHGDGQFTCDKCGNVWCSEMALKIHQRLHRERLFKCEICGVTAHTKSRMAQHMLVHTQKRDHVCPHCLKRFYARSVLTLHLRSHTGEKPYVCHLCPFAHAHRILYVKHMKKFHLGAQIYMLADMQKMAKAKTDKTDKTMAAEEISKETTDAVSEFDNGVQMAYNLEVELDYPLAEVELQI